VRIIINCDDLGASKEINDSIFDLMEQRRVTSATLMMNAPETEDALRRIGKYPYCSFGIHLNGTEFTPLTTHPGLGPLLNEKGEFAKKLKHFPLTAEVREGIFAEWCAQIERAQAAGVPISHIDSHEYVHNVPRLFGVFKRIQRKFHIRKVRLTLNVFGPSEPRSLRLRAAKLAWNFALRHYLPTITTDGFASFLAFHERLQTGFPWKGSIELMCHPGRDNFAAETELLRGNWKVTLAKDAQLISYNEL
jgi:chitin disaccharide deacetylase